MSPATCVQLFFILLIGYGPCAATLRAAGIPEAADMEITVPAQGAYTGAYIDFGAGEDNVTVEAIQKFEKLVQKHQAIIAFGNFWGEQRFSSKNAQIVSLYGAIPYIFWSPWDKPYREDEIPDRFNLYSILCGMWDGYIDKWADDARDFGKPLMVAWGLEMNGTGFPWSAYFYGGGQKDLLHKPADYLGPKIFKQAYRYVVDRVRARGAGNIQWVFQVNNCAYHSGAWNRIAAFYPGPDYVDWIGVSVYGKLDKHMLWTSFVEAFDPIYREMCLVDPSKPLMVSEWGVGEYPAFGNKAEWIETAFKDYRHRYHRIKAAIYWHERWQNDDGTYSNLRINSSPESLNAYREGVLDPYWIGNPRFHPKKASNP